MRIHIVNPSDMSFGVGVITPRWLYVLAGCTPAAYGDPNIVDETLEQIDPEQIQAGDIVGIGIHTGNALRGLAVGRMARERGAWVIYGGIHATLFPEEPRELGAAHTVVKGDGDHVWPLVIADCIAGNLKEEYDGGRVEGVALGKARWDLMPPKGYMWASVQTVRGCPKHCSFCSVWRTDGQQPRQRSNFPVMEEIVELRRLGYRFIALADDNFYPVTLTDLALAKKQGNEERLAELTRMRQERFELMDQLAELPDDMVFFTQITMEAAEDVEFLKRMRAARIRGGLVGVEAVTEAGLKSVFKDFNLSGENLIHRLKQFREYDVHVLGSFIFGLPSDREETFKATSDLAIRANLTFAQFVMMTPFPGTVDFGRWEKSFNGDVPMVEGVPITRYWRIPAEVRPKMFTPHPTMSTDEIRERTQGVWDDFYSFREIWRRADCVKSLKARLAFVLISKLYRQMYANTGISTDSARREKANRMARFIAGITRRLFRTKEMPGLQMPPLAAAGVAASRTPLVTLGG